MLFSEECRQVAAFLFSFFSCLLQCFFFFLPLHSIQFQTLMCQSVYSLYIRFVPEHCLSVFFTPYMPFDQGTNESMK